MLEEIKDWWEQSQADLKSARDLLQAKDHYACVVFSQQSAEKGLKAVYIFVSGKLPPKTHDLVELTRLIGAPKEIILLAGKLSGTYLTARYPGTAPDIPVRYYDEEKAQKHLSEAEKILQWAEKKIKL